MYSKHTKSSHSYVGKSNDTSKGVYGKSCSLSSHHGATERGLPPVPTPPEPTQQTNKGSYYHR